MLLVRLWKRKQSKGQPFSARRDLYITTLDMISSVAFGMDNASGGLARELAHLENVDHPDQSERGPAQFRQAPSDPRTEALLDMSKMISIAQGSPFPRLAQWLALLCSPTHVYAYWCRRSLWKHQTAMSIHHFTSESEKPTVKSALDLLLLREKTAAERIGRNPDYYSPAIRDEVDANNSSSHY